MTAIDLVIGVVILVALVVVIVLARRGTISWGWVGAVLGGALGLLGLRASRGAAAPPREPAAPPRAPSAATAVAPVMVEADRQSEEARARIREANDSPDRLDRLANSNDGGRQ